MNFFKKTKKGFTLVELVVVIAVIAILAAVSVGAYFGVTESANNSRAEQEAKQAYTQLQTKTLAGLDLGGSSKVELTKDGLVFTGLYNSDILSVMNGSVFEEQGVNYDVVAATGDVSTLEGVSENATVYFFGEKNESSDTVFSKYMGYVPANLAKKYVKYIELGNGSFVDSTALTGNYSEEVLSLNMVKHVITLDKFSNYNVKNDAYRYIGSYAIPSEVTYDAITVTNQTNINNNEIQLNRKNNGGIYLTNNELGKIFSIAFEWADNESNNSSDKIRFKGTTYEKYSVTSKDDVIVPSTETNVGELQYPNKFMTVDGNIYYGKIDTVNENATYLDSITVYYEKGNVPVKVNGIEIDLENTIFETGTSVQINATVSPANALDKTLTWSSSDETIATVDQNGLVSSKGIDAEGTVEITATSNENPNISETVSISFKKVVNYSFGMANNLSNLTNGSKILIGNRENNMVIGTASSNYFNQKSITDISEDLSDFNASFNNLTDIEVITLEVIDSSLSAEHAGKYALQLSNGKYLSYNSNASNNYLYEKDLIDNEGIINAFAVWNISFDEECNAIIENVVAPTRLIRYNKGNTRFSTYVGSSNQLPIQIFVDGYVTNTSISSFDLLGTSIIEIDETSQLSTGDVYPSFSEETLGSITYTSLNTGVATVDQNGLVKGVSVGTTTIIATTEISGRQVESNPFEIKVNIAPTNGYYIINSATKLSAGNKIVIASTTTDTAVGTEFKKYSVGEASIVKNSDNNSINFHNNNTVAEFELISIDGSYALKDQNGKYLTAVLSGNYVNTTLEAKDVSSIDSSSLWSISFETGVAHIKSEFDGITNNNVDLRYQHNNKEFSCYALDNTTYPNIEIYKLYNTNEYLHSHNFDPTTGECDCGETDPNFGVTSYTASYSGVTQNMIKDENNAALINLDADVFNVTTNKNSASNEVGLNKDGEIRLYGNSSEGNGTSLTIDLIDDTKTITSINIVYGTKVTPVKINDVTSTPTASSSVTYEINKNSFYIQNVTKGNTYQLYIKSIVIYVA